jgi:iron complex outermembrane recepter protein
VRQTSLMAGYIGRLEGVGLVNLGLQRASFRGRTVTAAETTATEARHWLYNVSLGIDIAPDLMAYIGTQRGLEDNGVAPQNATNRDEQLPAGLSRQYEAGLRWEIGKHVLLVGIFEITKPYYSLDGDGFYTRLGTVKHTGIEASFSGHFLDGRLSLLAGVAVMDPAVSGAGRDEGIVGRIPVGTRGTRGRIDLNYRTDLWGGFTPTLALEYRGTTAAASDPIPGSGGRQLELGSHLSIDIGFRQPLRIGGVPASLRVRVEDLLDQRRWLVPTSRTLFAADRRRFSAAVLVDF